MLFAQMSNNDGDIYTEMKSRGEACLPGVAGSQRPVEGVLEDWTPRLSALRSHSQPWVSSSEGSRR